MHDKMEGVESDSGTRILGLMNKGFDELPQDHPIRSLKGSSESSMARTMQTVSVDIAGVGALFYFDLTLILHIQDGSEIGLYNVGIWGPTGPGAIFAKAGGAINFAGGDLLGQRASVQLLVSPGVAQVSLWRKDGSPIASFIGTGLVTTFIAGGGEGTFENVRHG